MLREEQSTQSLTVTGSTGSLFDPDGLLTRVSSDKPLGEVLETLPLYDEFRSLTTAAQRPDWGRRLEGATKLARASRDLRAWVWLTRAGLCADGVRGLAAGLGLIAEGLERHWDVLPPQHMDEADPRERFMRRLFTLAQLGVTNFACNLDQLLTSGRSLVDLRSDLDAMVTNAVPDAATRQAIEDARAAICRIGALFVARFGAEHDPQLGCEILLEKLDAVEGKFATRGTTDTAGAAAGARENAVPNGSSGAVRSRDDVARALNQVLDYYEHNEPSSPVPLLIQRAKRLISLSFLDATRDLAPSGLKELQAVTGAADERK